MSNEKTTQPPQVEGSALNDGLESQKLAQYLSEKWWNERKISYNWDNDKDIKVLAYVIEHRRLPND